MTEKITNGVIDSYSVCLDRGFILSVWVFINHEDGGTQGFGGFVLGGTPESKAGDHANQKNLAAEWLVGVMRAAGVENMADLPGKAVRVKRADAGWNAEILGIGHIIKSDCWFIAKEAIGRLIAEPTKAIDHEKKAR